MLFANHIQQGKIIVHSMNFILSSYSKLRVGCHVSVRKECIGLRLRHDPS